MCARVGALAGVRIESSGLLCAAEQEYSSWTCLPEVAAVRTTNIKDYVASFFMIVMLLGGERRCTLLTSG